MTHSEVGILENLSDERPLRDESNVLLYVVHVLRNFSFPGCVIRYLWNDLDEKNS